MKLEKVLDIVNSLEKNSFLKIIDSIKSSNPKNCKEIDRILSDSSNDLKSVDSINIARVFGLVKNEYAETVRAEFLNTTSQLDILIDIIIKDGNGILKLNWFDHLYQKELSIIRKRTRELKVQMEDEKADLDACRKRDYEIYKACLQAAYHNDAENNRDCRITDDEQSILIALAGKLELSQEELKLINYLIIPPEKQDIETVVAFLKNIGVIFYSRKNNLIFVPEEIVKVLRQIRKKEVADKYYRRVLKALKEPQINLVCRRHNINIRELDYETRIKCIIKEGVLFSALLKTYIHKDGTNLTDKKKNINDLWENGLKISAPLKGITLEDKIANIIQYFDDLEKDEKVGISGEGYEKLIVELLQILPGFRKLFFSEFEMPEDFEINSSNLLDCNIKPRDLLDILPAEDLKTLISTKKIKSRGDLVQNVLDAYKDAENLLIENYVAIGARNLAVLKDNGILIRESELGIRFEDITKDILIRLGFNVDEKIRKQINTAKDQIDIVINLGNNDLIIVECKTVKESGYNKFSTVSRQIKSYFKNASNHGYNVVKTLLVAPDFSDDFINECDLEFEINLSLITASSLVNILEAFKTSRHKQFPYQLLMKDVLIKEERIVKAIGK